MSLGSIFRDTLLSVFFALNTALLGACSLAASLWSGRAARWFASIWAKINMKASGIKVKVEGLENLEAAKSGGGGVIIASNHNSAADIGVVLAHIPLDICWVAKDGLLKIPFIGWHLKRAHIPISRKKGGNTEKFLIEGAEKIKAGASVTIFPEGTRNRTNDVLQPFRKGAFVLALASGRPVVPVAIIGSKEIWPPHARLPKAGMVTLRMGKPIDPSQYAGEDLSRLADDTRQVILNLLEN